MTAWSVKTDGTCGCEEAGSREGGPPGSGELWAPAKPLKLLQAARRHEGGEGAAQTSRRLKKKQISVSDRRRARLLTSQV